MVYFPKMAALGSFFDVDFRWQRSLGAGMSGDLLYSLGSIVMRTQSLLETGPGFPWLEPASGQQSTGTGESAEIRELPRFPFTLGRNENCDAQVVSSRVSREHARIVRVADGFQVCDLGSTNGTFVNGQRVESASLADGDLLRIADVEFTFRCVRDAAERATATHVIAANVEVDRGEETLARDLIQAVRARHETLLCRGVRNHFRPIVDLASGKPVAFEALPRPAAGDAALLAAQAALAAGECRLNERQRQLHRWLATEQALRLPTGTGLFLSLLPEEVGADGVPEWLGRLQEMLVGQKIVAEIPDSAVADIPFFRDFVTRLRQAEIGVAFSGFAGSQHQVLAQRDFAPDFLMLSALLSRGVDRSTQRQRQIQAIVESCEPLGAKVIVSSVHTENEAQACRELGCPLAAGEHYGRPQTMDWPIAG